MAMHGLLAWPFRHRALLKAFVAYQVFGRYAGSTGGLLWSLAHPVAQVLVYSALFQFIFRVRLNEATEGTSSFILFFLTGFFPWLLFSEAVDRGCRSVLDNAVLVSKVSFPSELLPLASSLSAFLLNGIGLVLLVFYLALQRTFSLSWFLLPLILGLQLLFSCGLAFFLSILTVFFRDTHEVLRIVLNVWFYATPILYPASFVPGPFRFVIFLNPMAHFVDLFRGALFFSSLPLAKAMTVSVISLLTYIAGLLFFRRAKNALGDVL